jgi:hypothetical protein
MDKGIFKIFTEELLTVLPITVIVTALNILFCLTLPQFIAFRLCVVGCYFGGMASLGTMGSKIGYMCRRFPECDCRPEGKFAHFFKQLDYLICDGGLMALGFIAYGAALKKLEIDNLDKEEDAIFYMHQTLSFETPRDKIAYSAAGIFCFNFISFFLPRACIQFYTVCIVCCCFCLPPQDIDWHY